MFFTFRYSLLFSLFIISFCGSNNFTGLIENNYYNGGAREVDPHMKREAARSLLTVLLGSQGSFHSYLQEAPVREEHIMTAAIDLL